MTRLFTPATQVGSREKLTQLAAARQQQAAVVATLMRSLHQFAQRFSDALGDDFELIFTSKNGRVWITGIDRGKFNQIAIDLEHLVIKAYGPGGVKETLPESVRDFHWFPK